MAAGRAGMKIENAAPGTPDCNMRKPRLFLHPVETLFCYALDPAWLTNYHRHLED